MASTDSGSLCPLRMPKKEKSTRAWAAGMQHGAIHILIPGTHERMTPDCLCVVRSVLPLDG